MLPEVRRTLLAFGTVMLVLLVAVFFADIAVTLDRVRVVYDEEPWPQMMIQEITVHGTPARISRGSVGDPLQLNRRPDIVPPKEWVLNLENAEIPDDKRVEWERSIQNAGKYLRPYIEQVDNWEPEMEASQKGRTFVRESWANFELTVDGTRRRYRFSDYVEKDLTEIRPVTENGRRLMGARNFYQNDSAPRLWSENPVKKAPLPSNISVLPRNIQERADQGKVYRAAYTYFFTKNVGGEIVEPLHDLLDEWKAMRDELVRKVNGGDLTALDDLPWYY